MSSGNDRSPSAARSRTEPASPRGRGVLAEPPSRKRPKDRADRILAAAAQLFRERGYHGVGIDDIGEAVGTTGPAVYRHFDSKEALLVALAERSIESFTIAYNEGVAAATTPTEKVIAFVRASVAGAIDDRDDAAVYLREARHIADDRLEPLRAMLRANRRLWLDVLIAARPELTPDQAAFMEHAVVGLTQSVVYFPPPPLKRVRWEDVLTRLGAAAVLTRPGRGAGGHPYPEVSIARLVSRRGQQWPTFDETDHPTGETSAVGSGIYRGSRREAILAVAVRLFRQRGYGGVGVDEIGEAAGITGSGVYRHFENKEDLLAAAFNRAGEQLAAGVGRALEGADTSRHALERLVESYVELVIENSDLMSVWMTESHGLAPKRQAEFSRNYRAYVDDWIGVLSGLRPEVPDAEKRTMVQGALGLISGYTLVPVRLPLDEVQPILVSMATGALLAA